MNKIILVGIIFQFILPGTRAFAALGDIQFTQRAAFSRSQGDLSKNQSHLSFESSRATVYHSYQNALGLDLYHEFAIFFDAFKTRGTQSLFFPLTPHANARVIEPSLSLGMCLFSQSSFQMCSALGLSLSHIQTTIKNYQMYAGFPVQAKFSYRPLQSVWNVELGARYRTFRNRIEGFVSSHEDISYFIGLGYLTK